RARSRLQVQRLLVHLNTSGCELPDAEQEDRRKGNRRSDGECPRARSGGARRESDRNSALCASLERTAAGGGGGREIAAGADAVDSDRRVPQVGEGRLFNRTCSGDYLV